MQQAIAGGPESATVFLFGFPYRRVGSRWTEGTSMASISTTSCALASGRRRCASWSAARPCRTPQLL